MLRIPHDYRLPFLIAIALHLCLFIFLFVHMPSQSYRLPGPVAKKTIVQAMAVNAQDVQSQIEKIKQTEIQKKAQERARIQHLQAQEKAARDARLKEQQRLAEIQIAQKKLKAQKEKEAAQLKTLKAEREKALKKEQEQLQKKLLEQQLSAEKNQLSQSTASQKQGILDQYKAAILQAIGRQWVVPGGANKDLSSIYRVELGPGGVVLAVELVQSSGNAALDHSAKLAIYKASPLPVPKDPALFDNFRELRLTVSPQTVVKG